MKLGTLCFALTALMSASVCAQFSIAPKVDVDYRPALDTDEGGFWYKVDALEDKIKLSPYRISDTALSQYIEDLVCKLAGDYCSSIRVYLVRNPHFNASMYPNGMMHVYTGLLLRAENEAQLATVLGHEIAHYLLTHQIEQWRSVRDGAVGAAFLDIGLMMLTGVYGLGSFGLAASVTAFGRTQESDADILGMELMAAAGYDPDESAKLWHALVKEREADTSKNRRNLFFASHPLSEKRAQTLEEKAAVYKQQHVVDYRIEQANYVDKLLKQYPDLMQNHLDLQEYEQTEILLEQHSKQGIPQAYTQFFYGELYRLRRHEGDLGLASAAYNKATEYEDCPSEAHKQLAYLALKAGDKVAAKRHFENYLTAAPEASDKAMIDYYLQTL